MKITDRIRKAIAAFNNRELGCFTVHNGGRPVKCKYTYDNGSHCVVGAMLTPDELKRIKDAGKNSDYSIDSVIYEIIGGKFGLSIQNNLSLFVNAQSAHDGVYSPKKGGDFIGLDWLANALDDLAKAYGVKERCVRDL